MQRESTQSTRKRKWFDGNMFSSRSKGRKLLNRGEQCTALCSVPCDHLFLFVGGTATAAQVLAGRGQEVETVVLKGLICQRKQHLQGGNAAIIRWNLSTVSFPHLEKGVDELPDLGKELDFLVMR